MFISPFDIAIVDIVPDDQRLYISRGEHDPRASYPRRLIIALKEMIADKDIARPTHDRKMRKANNTVVADFGVV